MDDRVASAIAHWKPRFTANGVAASDFERISTTSNAGMSGAARGRAPDGSTRTSVARP